PQPARLPAAVLLPALERGPPPARRLETFERDQRDDEDRREAPRDLGRRPQPPETSEALDEGEQEGDEERVRGPAGDSPEARPGDVDNVAERRLSAVDRLGRRPRECGAGGDAQEAG